MPPALSSVRLFVGIDIAARSFTKAGTAEGCTAIAIVPEDVGIGERPALGLNVGPEPIELLVNRLEVDLMGWEVVTLTYTATCMGVLLREWEPRRRGGRQTRVGRLRPLQETLIG